MFASWFLPRRFSRTPKKDIIDGARLADHIMVAVKNPPELGRFVRIMEGPCWWLGGPVGVVIQLPNGEKRVKFSSRDYIGW